MKGSLLRGSTTLATRLRYFSQTRLRCFLWHTIMSLPVTINNQYIFISGPQLCSIKYILKYLPERHLWGNITHKLMENVLTTTEFERYPVGKWLGGDKSIFFVRVQLGKYFRITERKSVIKTLKIVFHVIIIVLH